MTKNNTLKNLSLPLSPFFLLYLAARVSFFSNKKKVFRSSPLKRFNSVLASNILDEDSVRLSERDILHQSAQDPLPRD